MSEPRRSPGRGDESVVGRRIEAASWLSNGVFLAGSIPDLVHASGGAAIAATVCLMLFGFALIVWIWAFGVAVARSSRGDDIAVGSLFLIEGRTAGTPRRSLYGSCASSLVVTAIAARSNPFAVLVPMLSLGFVGLWGAKFGEFPRRRDIVIEDRPLRPTRPTRQRGGPQRRTDG